MYGMIEKNATGSTNLSMVQLLVWECSAQPSSVCLGRTTLGHAASRFYQHGGLTWHSRVREPGKEASAHPRPGASPDHGRWLSGQGCSPVLQMERRCRLEACAHQQQHPCLRSNCYSQLMPWCSSNILRCLFSIPAPKEVRSGKQLRCHQNDAW